MAVNVTKEIAALQRMTAKQLAVKYAEVFGETTNTKNRTWLFRRVAWRIQALAEGDLSERAHGRAAELARDADIRMNPPILKMSESAEQTRTKDVRIEADERLPPPGTVLTRKYKGTDIQVKVLANGFEYAGEVHSSLSAVAKAITGNHCNGFHFFKLNTKGGAA